MGHGAGPGAVGRGVLDETMTAKICGEDVNIGDDHAEIYDYWFVKSGPHAPSRDVCLRRRSVRPVRGRREGPHRSSEHRRGGHSKGLVHSPA